MNNNVKDPSQQQQPINNNAVQLSPSNVSQQTNAVLSGQSSPQNQYSPPVQQINESNFKKNRSPVQPQSNTPTTSNNNINSGVNGSYSNGSINPTSNSNGLIQSTNPNNNISSQQGINQSPKYGTATITNNDSILPSNKIT